MVDFDDRFQWVKLRLAFFYPMPPLESPERVSEPNSHFLIKLRMGDLW
jgi:hypothetical protein